jgi:hypothetical protein
VPGRRIRQARICGNFYLFNARSSSSLAVAFGAFDV